MRWLVVVLLLGSTASAEPLAEAEVQVGYGMSFGGGIGGVASRRPTPLTIRLTGAMAFRDEPRLSAFGGLVTETLDRNSIGATAGVRLTRPGSKLRFSAGATYIFAPFTLWGATGSGGACFLRKRGWGICTDLQLTAFFSGNDLAEGHTVTQIQGVVGMVFDAF